MASPAGTLVKEYPALTTRILWLALAVSVLVATVTTLPDLHRSFVALHTADIRFLLVLAGLELVYFLGLGEFYRTTFQAARLRAGLARFLLISAASNFVNTVTKTSGFGGLAFFISEGKRRGHTATEVSVGYAVAYVLGYVAYLCVLVAALAVLYVDGRLTAPEAIAAAVLFTGLSILCGLLIAGLRNPATLERIFQTAVRPLNYAAAVLRRPNLVSRESVQEASRELYESSHVVLAQPARFLRPFGLALSLELLNPIMLYAVARAAHVHIGFDVALAGYAISLLFSLLSVTPGGLGFVEVSLTVVLASFGVARADAIAVMLGYRLFNFWVPIAIGSLVVLWLRMTDERKAVHSG